MSILCGYFGCSCVIFEVPNQQPLTKKHISVKYLKSTCTAKTTLCEKLKVSSGDQHGFVISDK